MRKLYLFLLLTFVFSGGLQFNTSAQSYINAKGVTFDIPGATSTYITCCNDSNDFGGYYYDGSHYHGFYFDYKLNDTLFVNYTGATDTWVYGINNYKVMVGSYTTTGSLTDCEGFKYTKATNSYEDITTSWLSTMDNTIARDINDNDCVIGDYKQSTTHVCFSMCGTTTDLPYHYNYNPTYIFGMNKSKKSVGLWIDGSTQNGLVRDAAGNWSTLNYPGALKTRPQSINDSNTVVGYFNNTRAFIYKHGVFKEVKKTGTSEFLLQDINNKGFAVGYYKNASNNYSGFYMPICDIGFRPDTNGWRFQNAAANMWPAAWYNQFDYNFDPYLGGQNAFPKITYNDGTIHVCPSLVFPDWPLFVKTFTEEKCYWVIGPFKFLSNTAFTKWRNIISTWGGSCFGFTQTSFMAWDSIQRFKARYPDVGPWNAVTNPRNHLYHLPINNENRLCINGMQIMQGQKDYKRQRAANFDNMTPRSTLDTIKSLMLGPKTYQYGILFRNQNGSGGHIVNPYKIEIDTINPNLEYIYVYDNNQPGDTTRKVTVNKSQNSWNYFLSVNAGVGEDPWGGANAHQGLYIIWPADSFYRTPNVDSVKYVGIAQNAKNTFFEITNTKHNNIYVTNSAQQSIGFQNGNLFNTIPNASPNIDINGSSTIPYGYLLPESTYSVLMKDFSQGLSSLSLSLDNMSYNYSRGNANISHNDKFEISPNGMKLINDDNITKTVSMSTVVVDSGTEMTFNLSDISLLNSASINFSVLNNDKLKVVNTGGATTYGLFMQFLSNTVQGSFQYDTIDFDANTTHIISMNWMNIQNADLEIYVDNGNNGVNDDTLYFSNQGLAQIMTYPAQMDLSSNINTDTLFIINAAAGSMAWSVTTDAPTWLTINGTSTGSGYGYVKYNAIANTGAARTGHITVTAPNASNSPYVIEVNQDGTLVTPSGLIASDGNFSDGVHVDWNAVSGATHYMLYRSEIAADYGTPITPWITNLSFIDNTALGGNYYFYAVKAAQSATGTNETGFSNQDDGWKDCFTADFVYSGECLGQPTLFTDMSSVHTSAYYLWDIDNNGTIDYTGPTCSHIFSTTGSKTIKLTVTDSSLCNNIITKTVNIMAFPTLSLPSQTSVCANQSVNLNAGSGFSSYLWSTGGTSSTEMVDSTGFGLGVSPIYVSVTNANGCAAIDTVLVDWYVCTEITTQQLNDYAVNIYPNPTSSLLNIDFEGNVNNIEVGMFDLNGRMVYQQLITEMNGHHLITLDTRNFHKGIYFLRCVADNRMEVKKVIVY